MFNIGKYNNHGVTKEEYQTLLESINVNDLFGSLFQRSTIEDETDLPSATVVFDLSNSSRSVRDKSAKHFSSTIRDMFESLTNIIYRNEGIVEKFPGDGISMHFPVFESDMEKEINIEKAILNACEAIMQMDTLLTCHYGMSRDEYRFVLTYGEDTILTTLGSKFHKEFITMGYAVNLAHKLEKEVKEEDCFLGVDEFCFEIAKKAGFNGFSIYNLPKGLERNKSGFEEHWYGVKY